MNAEKIVHVLHHSVALCGLEGPPGEWPPNNVWVGLDGEDANQANCYACGVVAARLRVFDRVPSWTNAWARTAYDAYGAVTEYKNFRGEPMPAWDDLPETIKLAWDAAAESIAELTAHLRNEVGPHVRRKDGTRTMKIEGSVPHARGVLVTLRSERLGDTCEVLFTDLLREWEFT